jgi:dTDP-4-amino-4,6-dideoxygalactose transaminase
MERIPFNKASAAGREMEYVEQAVRGGHIAGDGPFTRLCHAFFEGDLGAGKALLTTSCTHALEMAALLLDLRPGDEVILPSFTFVSTANAFVLRGARPVFADIRPDTLNLDEASLEALVTPRTRAVVPVHYGGVACEMDEVQSVARRHGLAVIEDNAHGLFGRYRGRALGTLGEMAAQSFHETKNLTCGEGGALLINDPRYEERAEVIREKGTNRSRFFRGQIDKYTWVDVGSSYLPSEMLAAFLWGQIEARDVIQSRRRAVWERYRDGLAGWAGDHGVSLPVVPAHCEVPFHLFHMVLPSAGTRDALLAHLRTRGISSTFHYLPLHLSEMGRRFGGRQGDCPVTERVSDCLIRLPFFADLTPDDQRQVIDAILTFGLE